MKIRFHINHQSINHQTLNDSFLKLKKEKHLETFIGKVNIYRPRNIGIT